MGYTSKGVTFNMADPDQEELLNFALSHGNFSGYVKRLIVADKTRKEIKPQSHGIKIKL